MRRQQNPEEILELVKVACEPRVFYVSNPLELRGAICVAGPIKTFVSEKLYPMPPSAKNPMCWNHRCDYIWNDFWNKHGAVSGDRKTTEADFWTTVRHWLPGVRCEALTEETTEVREIAEGITRKKKLYFWKEHTFELRGVSYNGRP